MRNSIVLLTLLAAGAVNAAQSGGVDSAALDAAVAPGDDFFRYANGGWLAATEIPPDRSSYGAGPILAEKTQAETDALIKAVAAGGQPPQGDLRKLADYYTAFMDEAAIERLGAKPLAPRLAKIAAIKNAAELARSLGAGIRADVDVLNNTAVHTPNFFGLWIAQDLDSPGRYVPFILQGGLSLPDRDYYLLDNPKMADTRKAFQDHVARLLGLAGIADAGAKAAKVVALETAIARTHASRVETIDVDKGDNHWTRADFKSRAPGLDWDAFFEAAGLKAQQAFTVWHPGAVTGMAALAAATPIEDWKDYLAFHAIERAAPYLSHAFVDENFTLYGTVLSGTPQLADRWKRAVNASNAALGDTIGRLYVGKYFPPSAKQDVEAMVANLRLAFERRIDGLTWMAAETKAEARAKLRALKVGIGYPGKWRGYDGLEISKADALGNFERADLYETRRKLSWLKEKVDRDEWVMTPQTVNAVNLPSLNALNFPAAILQAPYFDPAAPAQHNYGAIGAIIGHEISHSFDDQGAKFDSAGRLRNWWTKDDYAHFTAAGDALAKQFDTYRPFPDLAVNGRQTLSENIADLAGLGAAYDACKANCASPPTGEDFTADQIFFISFAQSWRSKIRDPALRNRVLTDGHAPPQYRALTVRNLDSWYDAFAVKPGQTLYLDSPTRVRVW